MPDVVLGVLGKVVQSNARIGFSSRLEVHLDHVRMPVGNGIMAEKTKGRYLDVLSDIKKSNVKVKVAFLCLAHALIIDIIKVNGDPKLNSYRDRKGLTQPVQDLLSASGLKLTNGRKLKNFNIFKIIFRPTKLLCIVA